MLVLQHDSISMLLTCCQSGIFDMSTRLRLAETRDAASRWVYQRADSKSWNPLVASDDDKARSGWLLRGYTTDFGGPAPAVGAAGPPTDIARATLPSWPCTSRIVTVSLSEIVIPEGRGPVNTLATSGFVCFGPPCRRHQARTGVKTERPQRSNAA